MLPWVILAHGRQVFYFAIGLGCTFAIVFWVNTAIYGTILGGYAVFASDFHSFGPAVFATILFSPSRGLFVFSPYLLFPLVLVIVSLMTRGPWFPKVLFIAAVASAVTVACYGSWSGGYSFGRFSIASRFERPAHNPAGAQVFIAVAMLRSIATA
jgi:hypothetical protein